jgi:hypothetical protein
MNAYWISFFFLGGGIDFESETNKNNNEIDIERKLFHLFIFLFWNDIEIDIKRR